MMLKFLRKILLAAFLFFTIQNLKAQTNETEPNNTKATSNTVTLNGTGKGHISPAGDVDWWKITTTSDGKLDITLTDYSSAYTNFYLFDNNGITQLNSGTVGSNSTNTFSTDGLAAGTYYIEFTGYAAGDTSTYSFTNTLTSAPVANDAEPDSTRALALTLPLNGSKTGHVGYYYNNHRDSSDWYKVTTTADGLLRLNITTEPSTISAYINYYLYDNDGITLINSGTTGSNTTASFSTDGLAAGTYYIKMSQYNGSDYVSYVLADSLFAAPVANDAEPDSTRALALTLPLNGSKTGHVGYYYNNHRDSSDWYKVTTNADGLLRLTITTEPSTENAYINYYLYDNNGTTVLNQNTTGSNTTASFSTDGLAAGTYYIRMTQYNNTDYVSYKLADSLFAAPVANDKEPDSTRVLALTLPLNGSVTGHVGYYYNNHRDSSDWYKVTTNADGLLRLTITTEPSTISAYINYYLYDNDGVTPINSGTTGSNTTASFSTDGLAAGTYYIKMTQYVNTDYVSYVLADSLFTAPVANDKEPNNSKATADSLPLNSTVTGHVGYFYNSLRDSSDWYKVTLNTDGDLRLTITTEPSSINAYINCFIYDNDGTTILNSNTTGSNTSSILSVDGLAKGTYYVRMTQYNINDYVSYVLADSLLKYQYAADSSYEPNKYAAQAKTILSDRRTQGHFGFYYNQLRDSTDWFKINYTGTDGNLSLVYNHLSHISNGENDYTNFYVYKDTSAASLYQTTFGNDASYTVNLTGLTEGYYYVKVIQYNPNDFAAYSLLDSFTQVDKALISINTSKTTINSSTCGADSITYNLSGSHSPYTVRLYKNGALYDSVITNSSSTTFKGLSAGNFYATVYGDGATDAAFSTSSTSTATPPVPTVLTTSGIGVHTATLNWTKLSCANYYKVQYRAVGSQTWITINTTGDTSKLALTGLVPYTLYAWQVASVDTVKGLTFTSAFADSVTFRTLSDTAHIALTFKGLVTGCNSDTLSYTSTNSQPLYTVTLYRNGVAYGSPLSVTSIASFYNVPPGNYYAKSTGTGSGGSYGLSDTTQILPPAPIGLDTSMVTPTTATLNWDAVSCSKYYTVEYKVTGTTTWTTVPASTNTLALTGLTPDTKYTWRVSASDSFNNQTVTSAYSDTATFMTSTILPVTFVSFSAVLNNGNALLNWSTSNEINNKGFQVERSNDGAHFNSIGFVNAQYGHSILNYSFTDNNIIDGSDYYRLKQIDVDGNYMYSKTIKLDLSKFAWSVSGNPVINNNSNILLKLDHTATVSVQIISLNGSVLQTIQKGNITAGNYTIPFRMNNVSAGIYIVKLMVDKQSYTTTIMKQ